MFGSSVLDIGIGLILVYLILSLVCTAANELLAGMLGWRATNLREGIRNLLDGPNPKDVEWVEKFYRHPLIQSLGRSGGNPSYIPSRAFTLALADIVLPRDATSAPTPAALTAAVDASPCPPGLKQVLRILIDEAQHASVAGQTLRLQGVLDMQKLDTFVNQVHEHIEIWFNSSMERVSGWYKRKVQIVTLAVAIVFAVGLNLDSVLIARHLARDAALRSAIVAEAEQLAKEPAPAQGRQQLKTDPGAEVYRRPHRLARSRWRASHRGLDPREGAGPAADRRGRVARRAVLVRRAESRDFDPCRREGARGDTEGAETDSPAGRAGTGRRRQSAAGSGAREGLRLESVSPW